MDRIDTQEDYNSISIQIGEMEDKSKGNTLLKNILEQNYILQNALSENAASISVSDFPHKSALPPRHKISDLLLSWCENVETTLAPATYSAYTYQMEHVLLPRLGRRIAEEFDEAAMAKFLAEYQAERRENGTEPSNSTISFLEVILRRAFLYAVDQGILTENPLEKRWTRNRAKASPDAQFTVLSPEDIKFLKEKLSTKTPIARLEILLPLYTGCILSELCAFSWQEVNLEKGTLTVRKNLLRVRAAKSESRTKTVLQLAELKPESQRVVHIPSILLQELLGHWGKKDMDAYLLTGTSLYLDPRTYQKHVRTTLAECGLENGSLTMLRDTYVAMCLEKGAGEYSLAKQLGIETERLLARYQGYLHPNYGFIKRLE